MGDWRLGLGRIAMSRPVGLPWIAELPPELDSHQFYESDDHTVKRLDTYGPSARLTERRRRNAAALPTKPLFNLIPVGDSLVLCDRDPIIFVHEFD